jgi:hypothetical protein
MYQRRNQFRLLKGATYHKVLVKTEEELGRGAGGRKEYSYVFQEEDGELQLKMYPSYKRKKYKPYIALYNEKTKSFFVSTTKRARFAFLQCLFSMFVPVFISFLLFLLFLTSILK